MNFDQSGLPPIQLVQDAFTYSYNYVKSAYDETFKAFEQQITRVHKSNLQMLEDAKRRNKVTEEEYKRELSDFEEMYKQQMKFGPTFVQNQLTMKFTFDHLIPARELFKGSKAASPEVIAALLLVECVRSPKDFKEIEKTYGPVVGGLVSDLIHIEKYVGQREANLAAATPALKTAFSAQLISSLMAAMQQAQTSMKRGMIPTFPEGHEEELLVDIKRIWGADSDLDDRLLGVFNKTAEMLSSKWRLSKDEDGDVSLVPRTPPKPPTPPNNGGKNLPAVRKPPGNGSIGGDVF